MLPVVARATTTGVPAAPAPLPPLPDFAVVFAGADRCVMNQASAAKTTSAKVT
jgi:hypothetical protein